MTSTSPGWYDDGHGAIRWWDGAVWTEHVATPDPALPRQRPSAIPADEYAAEQPTAVTEPLYPREQTWTAPSAPYAVGGYPGDAAGGYPGYAPGVYPGAEAAQYGAPATTTTEHRRSKLWIVWVVLGVIVLGVVIALAVTIPLLLQSVGEATGSSDPPTTADKQAAGNSVERYNEAWMSGDCEAYMATTTEDFRGSMEITNCETFAVESRVFASGVDDYVTTIGDVETVGNSIAVSATESYTSQFDAEGNRTDEPQEYEDHYEYIVVRSDGGWAIDNFYAE
jgi:hypothetical protein